MKHEQLRAILLQVDCTKITRLSSRESEVVARAHQHNKEIADHLGLSPHTVRMCFRNVAKKTGLRGRYAPQILLLLWVFREAIRIRR